MKRVICGALILVAVGVSVNAVPLGGKGSERKESVRGSMEIVGTLSVDGKTIFNGTTYIWPRTREKIPAGYVLKNSGNGILIWEKEVAPSGNEGEIQFNEKGSFSSDPGLVWDRSQKKLFINGVETSVKGHKHSTEEINGILSVEQGGTGTNNGSIFGTKDLYLSSAKNSNVYIYSPENGKIYLNGKEVIVEAPMSISSLQIKGEKAFSGVINIVTDVKLEGNTLKKKLVQLSVVDGVIMKISTESDWIDSGAIVIPVEK